jgi:hypothetical protein
MRPSSGCRQRSDTISLEIRHAAGVRQTNHVTVKCYFCNSQLDRRSFKTPGRCRIAVFDLIEGGV